MSANPKAAAPQTVDLDEAADQAIAACGGDPREAVKALIVANDFLESELDALRPKVSAGMRTAEFAARAIARSSRDGSHLLRRTSLRRRR
jgi:hypothetical protein